MFAPLLAEMEAVGIPESTLMNANLDDEVLVPPRRRSRVVASLGCIVPFATFQLERLEPFEQVTTFATVVRVEQLVNAPLERVIVAPLILRSSLMVSALSVSVMSPERERVVTPLTAPRVVTSNALESIEKLSPLSPRSITPSAVNVCPLTTVSPPEAVIREETPKVPVIEVLSRRLIRPEPLSKTRKPVVFPPNVRV